MNREFDKEIDSLLRRHTRAAVGGRVLEDEGSAQRPPSSHLDADELSAFAENALPAAARSLYVAHLADCGECRSTVAGLARTSNVSVESERKASAVHLKEPEAAASRGGWLAALFAPRVMRYAFPALALCLVGAIAFVALRSAQRDGGAFVAQTDSAANKGRDSITQQAPTANAPGVGVLDGATQNSNTSTVTGGAASNQLPQPLQSAEQQGYRGGAMPPGTTATGPAPTSAEEAMAPPPAPPPAAADTREAVGVVGEAAPAPKTLAKEKDENTKSMDIATRESKSENFTVDGSNQQASRAAPRKVDIDQMPDGSRNTQRAEQNNMGGRAANNFPTLSRQQAESDRAAAKSSARRSRSAEPRDDKGEDEERTNEAETRSASGHRFRRQGGAWVDVKYSTSMSMTGVRRGTDGYRALVADIPELGRIAEQLSGEVVVVIKGRAYRIR